ncbi:MAG: MFS transporter [Candidatus Limnocylindrales bacterium]
MSGLTRQAARLSYAGFFLLGWIAVLVPTLILFVEHQFAESDSGIGVLYLISAVCYVAGSLGGGPAVERLGRRASFPGACLLLGSGLLIQGLAPAWPIFVLGSAIQGVGAGALGVCGNSLVIDMFPDARSNALSRLHLCYALGALTSPLALSWLVQSAIPWRSLMVGTGLAGLLLAALLVPQEMTSGRYVTRRAPTSTGMGASNRRRPRLPIAVVVLVAATALYVGSEAGVTGWVVRYFSPMTTVLAPVALTLFWAGLAVGRIVSARISHRFDLVRLVLACGATGATTLVIALTVPVHPVSVALFAIVGLAYGPIYPSIMTLASQHYPQRSASVSGLVGTAASAGQSVYPPIMGFLSPTLGLGVGMLGAAVLVALAGIATTIAGGGFRTRRDA